MKSSQTIVDQALFGYYEGHRLIASSIKFKSISEKALLALTDMSGPRMVEGFEECVSGYPVLETDRYALAKTWYAPEMLRPGCVWSHVLLFRFADLSELHTADSLLAMFRRPQSANFTNYEAPITLLDKPEENRSQKMPLGDVARVIEALYGHDQTPVVIHASSSREYERFVIELWLQQWPALRSSFRFCNGSLSNRTLSGSSFDLQIVPHVLTIELARSTEKFSVLGFSDPSSQPSIRVDWIRYAATDIGSTGTAFRDFLWRYADPCAGHRSLFKKLSLLFPLLSRSHTTEIDLPQITKQICATFVKPDCGLQLKREFYMPATLHESLLPRLADTALLTELASTPFWQSLFGLKEDLQTRAHELWLNYQAEARQLLLKLLNNQTQPLSDEIIAGFLTAMSSSELFQLAEQVRGILLALLSRRPQFILGEGFWNSAQTAKSYRDILDMLDSDDMRRQISPDVWITSIMRDPPDELAQQIVACFGPEVINVCIRRAQDDSATNWIPPRKWRDALVSRQNDVARILQDEDKLTLRAIALTAGLLDAHNQELEKRGLKTWLRLIRDAPDLVRDFPDANALAFLLSVAFQHSEQESVELAAFSFEPVHEAAAIDNLGYWGWLNLRDEVPTLSRLRDWDKCERLRQALLGRFVRFSWPPAAFIMCFSSAKALRRTILSSREVWGATEFLTYVAEYAFGAGSRLSDEQREVFESSFRRNSRGDIWINL